MEEFPKKLTAYLNTLSETEKDVKSRLFQSLVERAQTHKFQSPRFWAMRQVLSGRSLEQIERNIKKRITKKTDIPGQKAPRTRSRKGRREIKTGSKKQEEEKQI
jgi:hypothetical protein